MARSVLPATWRDGARWERRQIHKRQRARARIALAGCRLTGDSQAGQFTTPDINDTYRAELAKLVRTRRGMDKEAPLTRWARARIAANPVLRHASCEEQVAHFAGLMPLTLIGRHAVSHIAMGLEWDDRRECSSGYCRTKTTAAERDALIAKTERLVRQILAAGLHGTLNANLRAAARQSDLGQRPRRLLLGAHDIAAFAREVASSPRLVR